MREGNEGCGAGRPRTFEEETVVEKALGEFWRHGYEATSVQDLVDATGLSRSSLYGAFGEKRDLFLRALRQYMDCNGKQMQTILSAPGPKRAAIRQLLERAAGSGSAPDETPQGCLVVNITTELGAHDPEIAALMGENLTANEARLAAALREAVAQGEITEDKDPVALARFLVNALHGLRVTSLATRDRAVLQNIVEVTLSVLD